MNVQRPQLIAISRFKDPAKWPLVCATPHGISCSGDIHCEKTDATLLDEAARRGETDFGRHILPLATAMHCVFAYDLAGNRVPGILPQEERNYWRDVGTIEAYRAAQRDASGPRPKFSLANERWPIGSNLRGGVVEHVAAAHRFLKRGDMS